MGKKLLMFLKNPMFNKDVKSWKGKKQLGYQNSYPKVGHSLNNLDALTKLPFPTKDLAICIYLDFYNLLCCEKTIKAELTKTWLIKNRKCKKSV